MNIEDPLNSNGARVSAAHRLLTSGVQRSAFLEAMKRGDSYDVEINDVALTTATALRGLLYIKNTNEKADLFFSALFFALGSSTGGAFGEFLNFYILANPTGGTLITAGTPLAPQNRKFGAGKQAVGDFLGHSGDSAVTGGTIFFKQEIVVAGGANVPLNISPFTIDVMLSPQQAIAVAIDPPAGNTSMIVSIGAQFHYEPVDELVSSGV